MFFWHWNAVPEKCWTVGISNASPVAAIFQQ
jgi:hypothetical protein